MRCYNCQEWIPIIYPSEISARFCRSCLTSLRANPEIDYVLAQIEKQIPVQEYLKRQAQNWHYTDKEFVKALQELPWDGLSYQRFLDGLSTLCYYLLVKDPHNSIFRGSPFLSAMGSGLLAKSLIGRRLQFLRFWQRWRWAWHGVRYHQSAYQYAAWLAKADPKRGNKDVPDTATGTQ